MDENLDKHWRPWSEEILSGMKEWRLAHPNATFRESENAGHERVSRLEAQIIQETGQADERSEWAQEPAKSRAPCPNGDIPLISRGKRQGGQSINV
jgi:hypothetical protein